MRLILILSLLLISSVTAAEKAAAAAKPAEPKEKKEKDEEKKDNKMKIGGGLYTTDKVANVKSNKGNRPVSILITNF